MKLNFKSVACVKVGRRRHRDDLGVDARARQHLRDRLRNLGIVDVAIVRRVDGEAEAVRIPGLGQELLRARRVECLDFEVLRRAKEKIRDELTGRNRLALHHFVDDGWPVDGFRYRLAHPRILQRILRKRLPRFVGDERRDVAIAIHVQVDEAIGDGSIDGEPLVLAQLRHIRGRQFSIT
jgi:hypothetical protein